MLGIETSQEELGDGSLQSAKLGVMACQRKCTRVDLCGQEHVRKDLRARLMRLARQHGLVGGFEREAKLLDILEDV